MRKISRKHRRVTIQLKPSIRPICLWGWSNACMGLNPTSTTPSHPARRLPSSPQCGIVLTPPAAGHLRLPDSPPPLPNRRIRGRFPNEEEKISIRHWVRETCKRKLGSSLVEQHQPSRSWVHFTGDEEGDNRPNKQRARKIFARLLSARRIL